MLGIKENYGQMKSNICGVEAQSNRIAFIRYITNKPNHKPKTKK